MAHVNFYLFPGHDFEDSTILMAVSETDNKCAYITVTGTMPDKFRRNRPLLTKTKEVLTVQIARMEPNMTTAADDMSAINSK